jgi:hypothetical protein
LRGDGASSGPDLEAKAPAVPSALPMVARGAFLNDQRLTSAGELLKVVDQPYKVSRQRLVQHVGPYALKVTRNRQPYSSISLRLGEGVGRRVFHKGATLAR